MRWARPSTGSSPRPMPVPSSPASIRLIYCVRLLVSLDTGDFSDERLGEIAARSLFSMGVAVIYQAAGRSGIGVIRAAQELGRLIISTGADYSEQASDTILASRVKDLRKPLLDVVRAAITGKVEGKFQVYGLADEALSVVPPDTLVMSRLTDITSLDELNDLLEMAEREVRAGSVDFSAYSLDIQKVTSERHGVLQESVATATPNTPSITSTSDSDSSKEPYAKNAATQPGRPLDVSREYPINVSINIDPHDGRFDAKILVKDESPGALRSNESHLSIDLTEIELKELNDKMRLPMDDIRAADLNPTEQDAQRLLHSLALRGYRALSKVFGEDGRDLFQQLWKENRKLIIHVTSNRFFLPWETLYPFNPDDVLRYECFWGMQHIVFRTLQFNDLIKWVPTHTLSTRPTTGVIANRALPTLNTVEIPFFEALDKEGSIKLSMLPTLNVADTEEGIRKFYQFCSEDLQIAHFACKAEYIDSDDSYITVTDNFDITLEQMAELKMKAHPFVIMNACETGNLNPYYTSYFARRLLQAGARGVVATESKINDEFASEFAKQLYRTLLAGWDIGNSLHNARNHFWRGNRNLSGLLYSLYAEPSMGVVSPSVFDYMTAKETAT